MPYEKWERSRNDKLPKRKNSPWKIWKNTVLTVEIGLSQKITRCYKNYKNKDDNAR